MDKKKVIEALNSGLEHEYAAIIQYLQHYYTASGFDSHTIGELFQKLSIDEMRHAEKLAKKIVALGGRPSTKVLKIYEGTTVKEMLKQDLKGEIDGIKVYQSTLKLVEDDVALRLMLEEIIATEVGHKEKLEKLLK